ncbi:hypothetical protein BSKO_09318 [Bryopsis sp. KO-2023]|nr:hypothetical protein BSKO_09318 [Bryopsis sp. KO-2023]
MSGPHRAFPRGRSERRAKLQNPFPAYRINDRASRSIATTWRNLSRRVSNGARELRSRTVVSLGDLCSQWGAEWECLWARLQGHDGKLTVGAVPPAFASCSWRGAMPSVGLLADSLAKKEGSAADQEERILISEVEVVGVEGQLKEIAEQALATKPNFAYTLGEIQADLARVFDTGYFEECTPDPEDTRDGVKLSIKVKANPELNSIVSTGGNLLPQAIFEDAFRGLHGKALNYNTFGEAVSKLMQWYQEAGVCGQVTDVSFSEGQASIKIAEAVVNRIDLRFLDAKTGDIKEEGSVRPEIVTRHIGTKTGSIYNMKQGKRDIEAIYSTGLFDDVNITPQSSPDSTSEQPKFDLVVNLVERKTGGLACGGGFSGQSHTEGALPGFVGNVSYSQKNLFRLGQRLVMMMEFGQIDKLFKIQYTDPWILGDRHRTSRTIGMMNTRTSGNPIYGIHEGAGGERGSIIIGRLLGSVEFSRPITQGWSGTIGLTGQRVTLMDDNNRAVRQDYQSNPVNRSHDLHDHMVTLFLRAAFSGLDNTQLVLSTEQALPLQPDWVNITKFGARAEKATRIGPTNLVVYGKGGITRGELPPYEAFPLGGTNSVRGYSEGGVGTARHYVEGTAELHIPLIGNLQGALFADYGTDLGSKGSVIGNPGNNTQKPGHGYGYGLGIRVDSPVGPLRLEWAWNDQRARRFHVGLGVHG